MNLLMSYQLIGFGERLAASSKVATMRFLPFVRFDVLREIRRFGEGGGAVFYRAFIRLVVLRSSVLCRVDSSMRDERGVFREAFRTDVADERSIT